MFSDATADSFKDEVMQLPSMSLLRSNTLPHATPKLSRLVHYYLSPPSLAQVASMRYSHTTMIAMLVANGNLLTLHAQVCA